MLGTLDSAAEAVRTRLHRITESLPNEEVHCRHGLFPSPTPGALLRPREASVRRFHLSHQGILLGLQRTFQILHMIDSPTDPQSLVVSCHTKGISAVQQQLLWAFPHPQQSVTELRHCSLSFGYFSFLLKHAFFAATEWIYLCTRSNGKLFKHQAGALVADSALFPSLQGLWTDISLKTTSILGQGIEAPLLIAMDNYGLDVVH